jgi:hypothetical protein
MTATSFRSIRVHPKENPPLTWKIRVFHRRERLVVGAAGTFSQPPVILLSGAVSHILNELAAFSRCQF